MAGAYSSARFGNGSGTIWLDNLGCRGSESDVSLCSSNGWGTHDCSHNEDAGVTCFEKGYLLFCRCISALGHCSLIGWEWSVITVIVIVTYIYIHYNFVFSADLLFSNLCIHVFVHVCFPLFCCLVWLNGSLTNC